MKLRMIDFRSENPSSCTVMAGNSSKAPTDSLTVPWSDTVRFVRQLSHDLRNDLNAIELQSAYIGELTQDQELTNEIKRLREVVSGLNSSLQLISRAVGEITPNLVTYPAGEFLTDMRTQIERNFSKENNEITWDVQLQDGMLNIDPQLFQEVFVELFANAFQHDRGNGALVARARISDGRFLFSLHEPKAVFSSGYAKLGTGTAPQHQTETLWPWSEPRPRYHRSARRRVAGSIRSQGRDARFDSDTPGVEPAFRTWLNLMAFSHFKRLQPTARA